MFLLLETKLLYHPRKWSSIITAFWISWDESYWLWFHEKNVRANKCSWQSTPCNANPNGKRTRPEVVVRVGNASPRPAPGISDQPCSEMSPYHGMALISWEVDHGKGKELAGGKLEGWFCDEMLLRLERHNEWWWQPFGKKLSRVCHLKKILNFWVATSYIIATGRFRE